MEKADNIPEFAFFGFFDLASSNDVIIRKTEQKEMINNASHRNFKHYA